MTPTSCCGFECGAAGTGTHWTVTGSPTFDTSIFRNGLTAGRVNVAAAAARFAGPGSGLVTGGIWVVRFAVYFATLPLAHTYIAELATYERPGYLLQAVGFQALRGRSQWRVSDTGATGVAVTTGQWYYVDLKVNCSANPHTVDVNVNGSACAQVTKAVAADTGAATGVLGTGSLDNFSTTETATMNITSMT